MITILSSRNSLKSYLIILIGIILLGISIYFRGPAEYLILNQTPVYPEYIDRYNIGTILNSFGLAIIITGIGSLIHEIAFKKTETNEQKETIRELIRDEMIGGMILLRDDFEDRSKPHSDWLSDDPQTLNFIGRDILNSMNEELVIKFNKKIVDELLRKIELGSNIEISFFNLDREVLNVIFRNKDERYSKWINDIGRSLSLSIELYNKLNDKKYYAHGGTLRISLFTDHLFFDYYSILNEGLDESDEKIFLDLNLGNQTTNKITKFQIYQNESKNIFKRYITSLIFLARDNTLLIFSHDNFPPELNLQVYREVYENIDRLNSEKKIKLTITDILPNPESLE
ncbi:hypothetical protein J2741_001493 [Methanolinea mesophila]|uniref:hypothetical protein n=1 Tax=Methanolinea mesophila TaxID=547055 RepID=UPI001AE83F64|nr:hypothetical protein [Methanolinea mesophila]MBP1928946.1 hypothetical protein [Methanolinea mesophila]